MSDTVDDGAWRPFKIVLIFDWARLPLSMNDRNHPNVHRRLNADIRETARLMANNLPALDRCRVTLTWVVTDRIRRDGINACATLKPLCDGLVLAGVVPDDTPKYMDVLMPVIEWRDKKEGHTPHLELLIERIP